MSGRDYTSQRGRDAELLTGSVDEKVLSPLNWPVEAWKFGLPTDIPRDHTLQDGNRLVLPALSFGYSKSPPKTLDNEDHVIADTDVYTVYILSGTLTANHTVTLPTLSANLGRMITFIDISTHGAYKWIIDGESAETINGFTTIESMYDGEWRYEIYGQAAEWKKIGGGGWYEVAPANITTSATASGTTNVSAATITPAGTKAIWIFAVATDATVDTIMAISETGTGMTSFRVIIAKANVANHDVGLVRLNTSRTFDVINSAALDSMSLGLRAYKQ